MAKDPLAFAHACTRRWFESSFQSPTPPQALGWPSITAGASTLLLAPTGSGKTLSAFLVAIDRLMFGAGRSTVARADKGVRILYVSPLKALGVDVERNLRAPLNGIRVMAEREGAAHRVPEVGVRSGDTPMGERERMRKHPPDILITTPESLYLLLTSRARETLAGVESVIIDEIHSMVATKRGAHLFLSLERLEQLRRQRDPNVAPLQRIGLSATQRPLDEIARLLGGYEVERERATPRPVAIVDASHDKTFEIKVEVPVEDMARLAPARDGGEGPSQTSIWPSIHPRLVELIRAHRSTMIFVNSRRLAERLAQALNELAEEEIARAHHGSVAKDIRADIEDRLKRGTLPAIVATSSLELGIDMGAVDLVIQIEAPPSIASGVQRIGRAGHHVGAVSRGVVFPKFRGDLLACAAVTERVVKGHVEETFYLRNPLDVLAQGVVATVADAESRVDDVFDMVRGAAPFAEMPRRAFEGVLDMLSGRYPSEELGDLRPRLVWDRIAGTLSPRRGAQMLAIANGGTIPDRGLYGVFLAGQEDKKPVRVGELDEEMVFESREGDVFLLGASSWRIEEITHEKVMVIPAPGEVGKMPFWHGDRPGRPLELGRAIGKLTRELSQSAPADAIDRLTARHYLDPRAAKNLVQYLAEQAEATRTLPTDRTIVIETFIDEVGDHVVVILSPFGARVHAPWSTAITQRLMHELGLDPDAMWSDDGMVFRLPDADEPPNASLFLPQPDEVERLVTDQLASTSLFAARFRENAGRALLLPKRRPGQRTPLWAQRRKSAQLLKVASRFADFPIVLETYRECLRDVFDLEGLMQILADVRDRRIVVSEVETRSPSPFASSLLFNYVASFIYEGDVPLAERRTQMLSLDHAQLRELLGDPELRQLLDLDAIAEVEARLQRRTGYKVKHVDGLHDLLLALGDLRAEEIAERSESDPAGWIEALVRARRIVPVSIGGEARFIAVEDMARYRDGLGIVPPPGLPIALLEPVREPVFELIARYARTHGPFTPRTAAVRFGLSVDVVRMALGQLAQKDRVLEGEFLPGGKEREWVDTDVLRQIKQRSLAKLRAEVEPVSQDALARFAMDWHGIGRSPVGRRGRGQESLLAVIEQLQGAPIPASTLESHTLRARLDGYDRRDLDELCASGELIWRGMGSLGPKDGRVALYLSEHYPLLAPTTTPVEGELAARIRELLAQKGAMFFRDLCAELGSFSNDVHETLWTMVWAGELTNDTLLPLRSLRGEGPARLASRRPSLRPNRRGPEGSEGRWSLLPPRDPSLSDTVRAEALVTQLLERHGILTREATASEGLPGGFSSIYPVLRAMEEAGRIRRGYFVAGLGATQFAIPGADDLLRKHRDVDPDAESVHLVPADDPANVYGAALRWPEREGARPGRTAGARVVLFEGRLVGFVGKTGHSVLTFLPDEGDPEYPRAAEALVQGLRRAVGQGKHARAVLLKRVDGADPSGSAIATALKDAGFAATSRGFHRRTDLH
ncbi:MAG: DEAD/DEAH box helicase [Sandaracinaceae bacterium]